MTRESDSYGPGDRVAVLLPLPLAGAYDYRVPDGATLRPGDVVRVPLGKRSDIGVVWGAGSRDVPEAKLKSVSGRLDAPPVSAAMRTFVDWVAAYTLNAPGAVLKMALSVPDALEPPAAKVGYAFNAVPEGLRLTAAREKVLEMAKAGALSAADLARAAGCTPSVVAGLAKAGALQTVALDNVAFSHAPDPDHPGPSLSEAQRDAASDLAGQVGQGFSVTLLDGVTGSGKTEVYFEAVAAALKRGQQVMVLLPEIALSAQWLGRFEARFGCPPALWHSDLTHATRRDTWRAIAEGRAPVVVGARSALFLPFPDLGLIIVDEEHDAAYKQEEGVIYNARDMAVVRGRISACPVVPVTATPSLETAINAESGRYRRLHLPERHGPAALPAIEAIDMRVHAPPSGEWLHGDLIAAVRRTLEAGEQAMLFLNRRGYAPLTLCRTCGHRLQCPRCTTWLVEHRRSKRLMCHHCGYQTRLPEVCPSCEDKESLAACGPGVERLAEEAHAKFPEARIAIASSDNLTGPGAAEDLVRRIEAHDVDLIIGTQIVAKGYHFPMLTLVGVVDADLGLSGGDLRAAERTYQLLHQVAGRAGRSERPGRVLLQTYMPDHAVMRALVDEGRDAFLKAEAQQRQTAGMPPFGRLAALIVSGRDERAVDDIAAALGRSAPHGEGIQVLGPAPAPLAMLRGKHRRRLLLKAAKGIQVQGVLKAWLGRVKAGRSVRVQVDIDPYSFL